MSTAPNRVAIETLRGDVQAGRVIDTRLVASARTGPVREYLVAVGEQRQWVPARECATPDP